MKEERFTNNNYLKLENTYTSLPEKFYTYEYPSVVPHTKYAVFNDNLAEELGLNKEFLKSKDGASVLGGNKILKETTPIAEAYAAHQFGYFTMLGDGRAVLLGEFISKNGERFDLQLKGSGRTAYSRGGDGKAVLGPMLREYIISEAMHALKIETTRSLAVVETGEMIRREEYLPGAVLARIAQSHIRVGTFQFAAEFGSIEDLKALADYTINRHFKDTNKEDYDNPYIYLFEKVISLQAKLIAKWQSVGFIHGVMNTDNMSICGESIDYGPCAFMDVYKKDTVFSSIDTQGRYAYKNVPDIGKWNLARLAEALLPLIDDDLDKAVKIAQNSLEKYTTIYNHEYENKMRKKLGLVAYENQDKELINNLLDLMEKYKADYTNTFLYLTTNDIVNEEIYNNEDFKMWYKEYQRILENQNASKEEVKELMQNNNPVVIPRNHRVEEALNDAVKNNDFTLVHSLLDAVSNPYDYSKINEHYTKLPKQINVCYKTYCGT